MKKRLSVVSLLVVVMMLVMSVATVALAGGAPCTQHEWVSGKCQVCHTRCFHPTLYCKNTDDPTCHFVRCSVCNFFFEYEDHDLSSGKCKCGYENKSAVIIPIPAEDPQPFLPIHPSQPVEKDEEESKSFEDVHWYGEWTPNGNGGHTATCKRHGEEKTVACETVEYTLGDVTIKLCPVCGLVEDGTTLNAVSATANGKGLPDGEIIMYKGAVNGETVMSIGFEIGGNPTQPKGDIKITLPTSELNGCILSVLNADGTETALETTEKGENTTFTINFDGVKVVTLHLSAAE